MVSTVPGVPSRGPALRACLVEGDKVWTQLTTARQCVWSVNKREAQTKNLNSLGNIEEGFLEEAAFELGLDTWPGRGECERVVVMRVCGWRRKDICLGPLHAHRCVGIGIAGMTMELRLAGQWG